MGRDRSLDEFFSRSDADGERDAEGGTDGAADPADERDGSGEERGAHDSAATGAAPAEAAGETTSDAVEPAVATYRFDPGGAACAACGAPVEARWLDEGRVVCTDCKEW